MKKSTRIVKKYIASFLVVLMSINSLGAVVSDNDGSAFITKAEFDSPKNNFQNQIDQYNTSIDSKIDGAIAVYLAGLMVQKKGQVESVLNKINAASTVTFTNNWTVPVTQVGDKWEYCFRWVCNQNAKSNTGEIGEWTENFFFDKNSASRYTTGTIESYLCKYEKSKTGGFKVDSNSIYKSTPFLSSVSYVGGSSGSFQIDGFTNTSEQLPGIDYGNIIFQNASSLFQTKTIVATLKIIRDGTVFRTANWTIPTTWSADVLKLSASDDAKINNLDYYAGNAVTGQIVGTDSDEWEMTDETFFAQLDYSNLNSYLYFRSFNSSSDIPHTRGTRGTIIGSGGDDWHWNGPTIYVYQRKNDNISATSFVNKNATEVAGYDIFYYNGVPIISNNDTERLYKLELVFTDDEYDGDSGGTFALRSSSFTNSNALDSSDLMCFSGENQSTNWTDWTISSTSLTKTIYCVVPKGKQIWIKIKPNGDNKITVNTRESNITYTELN